MADKFDPYREALVIEAETTWPDEYQDWDVAKRGAFERKLHAEPEAAATIQYIKTYTGFCRTIEVTPDDVARLGE